jgi:DNA-binding transcriptional ArsR family regulator
VLIILANRANDSRECWPSMPSLIEDTGLSERSIQDATRSLSDAGLLEIERGGGRKNTNLYRLKTPQISGGNEPKETPQNSTETPQNLPETVQHVRGIEVIETPQNLQETPQDLHETPQISRETPQGLHPEPKEPKRTQRGTQKDDARAAAEIGVEIWNSVCAPLLPAVTKLSDPRIAAFNARLKGDFGSDAERWRQFCQRVMASEFLSGTLRPGFDWVLKPANTTKILEGNYDNRRGGAQSQPRGSPFDWAHQDAAPQTFDFDLEMAPDEHGHFGLSTHR